MRQKREIKLEVDRTPPKKTVFRTVKVFGQRQYAATVMPSDLGGLTWEQFEKEIGRCTL